jgi:hypothetical protein
MLRKLTWGRRLGVGLRLLMLTAAACTKSEDGDTAARDQQRQACVGDALQDCESILSDPAVHARCLESRMPKCAGI